jgi:hypothetical protein
MLGTTWHCCQVVPSYLAPLGNSAESLGITWHYFRVTRHYSAPWQLLPSHLELVPSHSALLGTGKIGFSGTLRGTVMFARRPPPSPTPTKAIPNQPWRRPLYRFVAAGGRSGPTIDSTYITADPSCEFEARRWCICYAASPQTV